MQMLVQVKLTFLFSFHHAFPFMNSYSFGGSAAGPVLCVGRCAAGTTGMGGPPRPALIAWTCTHWKSQTLSVRTQQPSPAHGGVWDRGAAAGAATALKE